MNRFKKMWNNRIFRTFIEAVIGSIAGFFVATNIFEIDSQALIGAMISAFATGISMILPLFNESKEDE